MCDFIRLHLVLVSFHRQYRSVPSFNYTTAAAIAELSALGWWGMDPMQGSWGVCLIGRVTGLVVNSVGSR